MENLRDTENMKAAKILRSKLGVSEPNCFNCIWYGGETDPERGLSRCNSIPAVAVLKFSNVLRSDPSKANAPFFPVVTFVDDQGEEHTIGGIIAHEAGYGLNQMAWPERYNPVFILFCLFYTTHAEAQIENNQDIDNSIDPV